jgi:hypothetical protein
MINIKLIKKNSKLTKENDTRDWKDTDKSKAI